MKQRIIYLVILGLVTLSSSAQEATPQDMQAHAWTVSIEHGTAYDTLLFVDMLSADTLPVQTHGERYTLLSESILYFDTLEQQVKVVTPQQSPKNHPFIQLPPDAKRIDWVVSKDKKSIAWTITYANNTLLTTITYIADYTGSNVSEVLRDGPRDNVRILPIQFSADNSQLYMDAQPDGIAQFAPYTQYAGLFALDLITAEITTLPGEPDCFCGAGFGAEQFIRLSLNDAQDGFDVKIHSLDGGEPRIIDAITRRYYTQAGDVLFSNDGNYAVYALSQVSGFGTIEQIVRTIFIRIDLLSFEQAIINNPITTFVHPIAWTEDNTALILTSEQQSGTWKMNLETGEFKKVATTSYIGQLRNLED
jgi:hypothetical protein